MDVGCLKELGLSNGQISVYSAVLELGAAHMNKIQERTRIERRNIYDILNKLIQRGLVTYVLEDQKRVYRCTHPSHICEEISTKKLALDKLEKQIPQISAFFEASKPGINVQVFKGHDAFKALLNETLQHDASYWMGANSSIEQTHLKTWFKQWMRRRAEQKRLMYDLANFSTHFEDCSPYDVPEHKKQFYKYGRLPLDLRSFITILIFGNKVAQIIWGTEPYAFVVESKEVKESYMKYFNQFWDEPW